MTIHEQAREWLALTPETESEKTGDSIITALLAELDKAEQRCEELEKKQQYSDLRIKNITGNYVNATRAAYDRCVEIARELFTYGGNQHATDYNQGITSVIAAIAAERDRVK